MADVRVADLPTAGTINGSDYLIIDNSGVTSKTTVTSFKSAAARVTYPWNSEVPVTTGIHSRWYADRNGTIAWCRGEVVNGDGVSTAGFDVSLNGSTIYPTATKPSVSAGSFIGTERTPDTTSFSKGDYFQVNVTSTGGTTGRLRLLINFY